MKDITTCEVINTEDEKQMTITTEWLNDDVKIVLLRSGMLPLLGETTITKICESSRSGKTREDSLQEMRNELSGKDKDTQFSLRETKLIWKKRIWRKGTVEMKPIVDIVTLTSMNIEWLGNYSILQETSLKLQEDNKILVRNTDELKNKLKEMEIIKKSMQDSLYKQFLLLLNSKKRKIRELEDKLSNFQVSDTRSIYEVNTDVSDDDDEKVFIPIKRQKPEEISNPIASNPIASNPIASNPIASTPIASTSSRMFKTSPNYSPESDDEIVLRYDESQQQDFDKLDTEEDPEDDLFSQ